SLLMRSASKASSSSRRGNGASSAGAALALEAPESIRFVIAQRLGRLAPLTQEGLREASGLGRVGAFADLRRMSRRGEQEVEEALEEAAGAGIVHEGTPDHYYFNHALTVDTLYAELSARRKRRLRRQAADALEGLPDHAGRAAELAYHLRAADEAERALPYGLLAGDQAEAVYAHAEAERHYRAALEWSQELGDSAREAAALEKLGQVLSLMGTMLKHCRRWNTLLSATRHSETWKGKVGR